MHPSPRLSAAALLAILLASGCRTVNPGSSSGAAARPTAATTASARPGPLPPDVGAVVSGRYRNLFSEWDARISAADVDRKLDDYWRSLFGSDPDHRVYYPAGANANGPLAYILDTGNDDVRTEGMSYGMMIAVQMNHRAEFDALWNWAKTNMQYRSGPRAGYFQWHCRPTGCAGDAVPASDGEQYFATALFLAAHRWGNRGGIFDYEAEANRILDVMLHREDINGGVVAGVTNMFDHRTKEVVFVPVGDGAGFSDPSYHLPAFYELWARWAAGWNGRRDEDRRFWHEAAATSRRYFARATNPATGLGPDYADFDGTPRDVRGHGDFRYDAFRIAVNWSVDYAWWAADPAEKVLSDRLQAFFDAQGMDGYVNQYTLAGAPLSKARSTGLIACNGAASLAATQPRAWRFVEALWKLEPPSGRYRYYDGLLAFMAVLHAGGRFRVY